MSTKGFINLQFLQKLSSQKPFWDEARLSSLVNKRLAGTVDLGLRKGSFGPFEGYA